MPAFGSNAILSITLQNSFDGDFTNPGSWWKVPFASHDFDFAYAELTDDSIQARYDEPDRATGIAGVTGSIVANVHPIVTGHLIRGCFGISSSTLGTSAYVHTFNPQTTTFDASVSLPPYSFQVDQGEAGVSSAYMLTDCFVNQWELMQTAGEYLRSTWSIIGKNAGLGTKAPPPDYTTGIKPFLWDSCSISFGGAAVQRYEDFTLTFNNNIGMQDRIAGAKTHTFFMRDGFRQFGQWTGTADVSQADWLNVRNETEVRLVIYCKGKTQVGDTGEDEYLMIDIPRFVYTAHPLGVAGPGIVTVAIAGRAMYSSDSGTIATVTLQNTFQTYNEIL